MQTWIPPNKDESIQMLEFDLSNIYDPEYHFLTIIRDLVGIIEAGKYYAPLMSEYRKTAYSSFYLDEPIPVNTPVALILPKYRVEANIAYYEDNSPYINTGGLFTYEVGNVTYREAAKALVVTYGIKVQQLPSRPYDPNYALNVGGFVNLKTSYATYNNLGNRKEIHYTSNYDGDVNLLTTTPNERTNYERLTSMTTQPRLTGFDHKKSTTLSGLRLFRRKKSREKEIGLNYENMSQK